jgi:hydrogenase/urease accessory protein HupE
MSLRIGRVPAIMAALVILAGTLASAHPAPYSYVDLILRGGRIDGALVVHALDLAHDLDVPVAGILLDPGEIARRKGEIVALLGPRLSFLVDGSRVEARWTTIDPAPEKDALRLGFVLPPAGPVGVVEVRAIVFPYDPVHQTFVNVYEGDALALQGILDLGKVHLTYYSGTRQGTAAVIRRFVPAGVHHILIGPDHILFLVGLLLLGGSVRRLLVIVSAFTLAHSVTLSLAALDVLTPPARLIEPAIALSIVYVGADNLLVRGGRDVRAWIALGFGLIHGFGFANVLRAMDLPSRALGWSLFSFNLGVEVGQLVVVAIVASALGVVRARSERAGRAIAVAGSLAVIAAGAIWFVERVFASGGVS